MGNSTNKKDAQTNAARDFVNYLVRIGEMSAAEVPAPGVSTLILWICQLLHKHCFYITSLFNPLTPTLLLVVIHLN